MILNLMQVLLILFLAVGCTPQISTTVPTPVLSTSNVVLPTATTFSSTETSVPLPPGTVLAGKEMGTINVGLFPQQVVVGEGAVWVPNAGSGTISRIDPQTNKIVATIPIGNADPDNDIFVPSRMTIGDGFIWAAKNDADAVVQIDPQTNQMIATIPIGVDPFALAVHEGTLWVTSRFENSVVRVDLNTQQVVAMIADIKDPAAIVLTEDTVWVVNHRDDAVTRIDPLTNQIVASVSLGSKLSNPNCGSCVSGLAIGEGAVWVSLAVGGVVRIDPQTNQVVATIPTKEGTFGIVSDAQGTWFANWEDQAILRIDPQSNQIMGAIPFSAPLAFLASGEGSLWATTDFADTRSRNKVIRFDIQP
jgi:YVTN family beta-propeller protein